METLQLLATAIFAATILLVITGFIDRAAAAVLGVVAMVLLGVMDEREAFNFVDWNVIAILGGIWIIAAYFVRTGVPEFLAHKALAFSRGNTALAISVLAFLAGLVSMLLDNVVVILMFAPVVIQVTHRLGLGSVVPAVLLIGLSANFMGTALLLGDLPPQMLHSVSGIEFPEFIWQFGRPSSFPILTLAFLITLGAFYFRLRRLRPSPVTAALPRTASASSPTLDSPHIMDKGLTTLVMLTFTATVLAMALREQLGFRLGFIALSGAVFLIIALEVLKKGFKKTEWPAFEEVLASLDWRAVLFYIALFALVGGLEHVGIIRLMADALIPLLLDNPALGASILYWVTLPIVAVIEHDAYILTFLFLIRDLAEYHPVNPWPLWWVLVWAGTLGSNLTVAGAPALYVALNLCEREEGRKVRLGEFFSYSVPFVLVSTVVTYLLALVLWILPQSQ